ncbi:hypothetical protein FocTR4_00005590 [Fusarium oxysporum f. sp. cubense]|uniref:Uncharacterized protein n=1 Tax=Fusarium oxysporum f. sp. cubense TaxID=61366 RepID=A0A5C6TEW7_FUSOC|nr:hypothetical protein FocTR4_00005590 [Fusarium oxysporum f. sp. cubense]
MASDLTTLVRVPGPRGHPLRSTPLPRRPQNGHDFRTDPGAGDSCKRPMIIDASSVAVSLYGVHHSLNFSNLNAITTLVATVILSWQLQMRMTSNLGY